MELRFNHKRVHVRVTYLSVGCIQGSTFERGGILGSKLPEAAKHDDDCEKDINNNNKCDTLFLKLRTHSIRTVRLKSPEK